MQALERAVQIAGGQSALAEKIGKKQAHIAMWIKRGKVPAEVCVDIEAATAGAVKREELRPDVFRSPSEPPAKTVSKPKEVAEGAERAPRPRTFRNATSSRRRAA